MKIQSIESISSGDEVLLREAGADGGGHPLSEEAHALRRGDDPRVVRWLPTGAVFGRKWFCILELEKTSAGEGTWVRSAMLCEVRELP